eukprot:NODE_393_length_1804_cov_862.746439_g330_i0.p1 GENE.NODE_393_length_1804_cov_862.746439_g330_i0~~NODE_393_length_1804_cov_862.746439_g330_i0.p1  ORF type:complete len:426 (-),score=103.15 NODE_393_length_1804_cov_862.746439_g330_i0:526-1746(-)
MDRVKQSSASLSNIIYSVAANKTITKDRAWRDYPGGAGACQATRHGDIVVVQGILAPSSNPVKWGAYARLPADLRPAKMIVANGVMGMRIDIFPNGEIRYAGGQKQNTKISLCGITFAVGNSRKLLTPIGGASNYVPGYGGATFEGLSVSRSGDYVVAQGLAHTKNWKVGQPVTVLPAGFRPAAREAFLLANTDLNSTAGDALRVDVYPSGEVVHHGNTQGGGGKPWTSLAGISFVAAPGTKPAEGGGGGGSANPAGGGGAASPTGGGGGNTLVKGNNDMTKCQQNVCTEIKKLQKEYTTCENRSKDRAQDLKMNVVKKQTCVKNKISEISQAKGEIRRLQGRINVLKGKVEVLETEKDECTDAINKGKKSIAKAEGEGKTCKTKLATEDANYKKFNCKGSWRDAV